MLRTMFQWIAGTLSALAATVPILRLPRVIRSVVHPWTKRPRATVLRHAAGPALGVAVLLVTAVLLGNLLAVGVGGILLAIPNVVILKGDPLTKEGKASEAITPGHLLEPGGVNDVQKHSAAGENAAPMFADIADPIGGDKDQAYAAGNQVKWRVCRPGDEVNALVAAGAAAIADGVYLESAGDGTLRVLTAAAATTQAQRLSVVARALEAVDNSAGTAEARIVVEVV